MCEVLLTANFWGEFCEAVDVKHSTIGVMVSSSRGASCTIPSKAYLEPDHASKIDLL